jgi:hypothetical protein
MGYVYRIFLGISSEIIYGHCLLVRLGYEGKKTLVFYVIMIIGSKGLNEIIKI